VQYSRLAQSVVQLKSCLAEGYPFLFGFTVYEGFESDAVEASGVVSMPEPSEAALGGHAVSAVGYDDASQRFLVRNSWSANWGMQGYFTIPYAYLAEPNLAADFWTIRVVK
jgi:C1A family cysteine protease